MLLEISSALCSQINCHNNSQVAIYTPESTGGTVRVNCLAQEHYAVPQARLDLELFDLESSSCTLTIRPLCLIIINVKWVIPEKISPGLPEALNPPFPPAWISKVKDPLPPRFPLFFGRRIQIKVNIKHSRTCFEGNFVIF